MKVMVHQVEVDPAEKVEGAHGGEDDDDVGGHDVVAPWLWVGQGTCTEDEALVGAEVRAIHGDNSLMLVQLL